MKRLIPQYFLLVAFGVSAWQLTACKHTPSPPTEQDAIAVWNNIARTPHLRDLVDLKKTNGQMEEVNGVPGVHVVLSGNSEGALSSSETVLPERSKHIRAIFHFSGLKKGWMGPDHQVYPEQ